MKHRSAKNRFEFNGNPVSGMRVDGMQDPELEQPSANERLFNSFVGDMMLEGLHISRPNPEEPSLIEQKAPFQNMLDTNGTIVKSEPATDSAVPKPLQ